MTPTEEPTTTPQERFHEVRYYTYAMSPEKVFALCTCGASSQAHKWVSVSALWAREHREENGVQS